MDQKKIGAFIAQCRKEKSLTQIQLAELLDITNQAVSKWENGRGMPDVSLFFVKFGNIFFRLSFIFLCRYMFPRKKLVQTNAQSIT